MPAPLAAPGDPCGARRAGQAQNSRCSRRSRRSRRSLHSLHSDACARSEQEARCTLGPAALCCSALPRGNTKQPPAEQPNSTRSIQTRLDCLNGVRNASAVSFGPAQSSEYLRPHTNSPCGLLVSAEGQPAISCRIHIERHRQFHRTAAPASRRRLSACGPDSRATSSPTAADPGRTWTAPSAAASTCWSAR